MQAGQFAAPRQNNARIPRYLRRKIHACLRAKPARRIQSVTELRRLLELRMGDVSPADCRDRIAQYLRSQGLVEQDGAKTELLPAAASVANRFRRPLRRWMLPVGAATVVTLAVAAGWLAWRGAPNLSERLAAGLPLSTPGRCSRARSRFGPPPRARTASSGDSAPPRAEAETLAVDTRPKAQVRFVADPWALVRVDDAPPFHTPRASPLELSPGDHTIVFEHPRFGRRELVITLEPGQQRVVRHAYREAAP